MSLLHNICNRLALQEMNIQLKLPLLAIVSQEEEGVSKDYQIGCIEGLLFNTAYHVVVLASGPRGNVNSTSVFYTTPKEVQGEST